MSLKLKRLLDQYDLSDMDEIEDYEIAIPVVNASVERFECVHVEIKRSIGEEEYTKMYPDFDTRLKHFTDWICNAQRDLRQKNQRKQKE